MNIQRLANSLVKEQVRAADRAMFQFLAEQGVTTSKNIEQIRADLKAKNLDLIIDQNRKENGDIEYVLTLNKVIAKRTLLVKYPKIAIV